MVLALRLKEPLVILLTVLAIVGAIVVLYVHKSSETGITIVDLKPPHISS